MAEEDSKIVGKAMPGPISKELAAWSREFRTRWFRSHRKSELTHGLRANFATVGAFVYLLIAIGYLVGTEPYFSLLQKSTFFLRYGFASIFLAILVLVVPAYFLGRLVVFHDKDGGPVRAFLGGVALPAIVVVIARTSLWIF